MRRRHARWLIALWVMGGLALLIIMAAIILPPVLSADYHRAAIEALASRLTGRQVIIKGPIRLSMVPEPQLNAADISIGVPHGEQISAASLRLDLAPRALLLGRLRATRLTLHAPRIVIPWPLPEGAASILPPPWLASLHAKVVDGTIILGRLVLDHADLSIFTGGKDGILAASGTGTMFGMPMSARLNLAGVNDRGLTPVTASIATPISALAKQQAGLSFSGTVNGKGLLAGRLAGSAVPSMVQSLLPGHILPAHDLAAPIQFTARASASRTMIRLSAMRLSAGVGVLQGHAVIGLTTGATSLALRGHDIDITPVVRLLDKKSAWNGKIKLRARLNSVRLGGFAFDDLATNLEITPDNTAIHAFSADLPGQGRLGLIGTIGPHGLRGAFTLADQAPPALFKAAALAVPALAGLPLINEPLHLAGSITVSPSRNVVRLDGLHGGIGPHHQEAAILSTGGVVAKLIEVNKRQRLDSAANLSFARLDATPLLDLIRSDARPEGLRLDLALTARRARLGGVEARRLLLDAKLGRRVNVRAFDFHAVTPQGKPAALVALRGARAAGVISDVNLLVAGPDVARALGLLPQDMASRLPRSKAMMRAPFAVGAEAFGPAAALALKFSVNLGDLRIRAAPKVDLVNQTATGAVSLRMPDAITLAKLWDRQAGLAWPGAGSAGLRADFTYAPKQLGLSNFVLSFGALTASGRLVLNYGSGALRLSGVVNADRLALPPANTLLRLANAPGRLILQLPDIRAAHVLLGGVDVADDASTRLSVTPDHVALGVNHANVAGGVLTGQATLNTPAGAAPLVKANLKLDHADAAALKDVFAAIPFPPVVSAGRITMAVNAQASGYTAKTWAATLGGALDASGENFTIQGLGLAGAAALTNASATAPNATKLRQVLFSGTTHFTAVTFDGDFASGALTIGKAELTGDAGSVTLSGTVDLPERSLAVTANLQPASPDDQVPPKFKLAFSGPWLNPKQNFDTTQSMTTHAQFP